jgi:glutamate 5-kinase
MPDVPSLPTVATPNDADNVILDDTSGALTGKISLGDMRTHLNRANVVAEAGATRAIALGDEGATIRCTAVGGCTLTIPSGLPTGWSCLVMRATGAGAVQIDAGVGVTLEQPASTATPAVVGEAGGLVGIMIVATDVANLHGALG